jgi:hypothetical protein
MTDLSTAPDARSHGAERMRRHRERRQRSGVLIEFEVVGTALDGLIELGWLDPDSRGDRDAVRSAVIRLAAYALALRIRPGG